LLGGALGELRGEWQSEREPGSIDDNLGETARQNLRGRKMGKHISRADDQLIAESRTALVVLRSTARPAKLKRDQGAKLSV